MPFAFYGMQDAKGTHHRKLNLEVLNENRNLSRSSSSKCDVMKGERECRVFQAENRYDDQPGCSVSEMVV